MKRSTSLSLFLFVTLVVTSTGCKKLLQKKQGPAVKEITQAPTPSWKDHEVILGGTNGRGSFFIRGTKLDVSFHSLPAGTAVAVGDQKTTADVSGTASLSVDIGSRIAKLAPRDAFDFKYKFDSQTKVDLDFGKGIKLTLDAPAMSVNYGLTEMYKKAPDTPIALPAPASAPAEHTVLLMASTPEPLGPAATVDAIDWIAIVTKLPERAGKTCSGYSKTGSKGSAKSIVLQLIDERVNVFEVRTSRAVASKDFKAKDDCPMIAFGGAAKTYASTDEEKAWLRELRAKK